MLRSLWVHIVEGTTMFNDKCLRENIESQHLMLMGYRIQLREESS